MLFRNKVAIVVVGVAIGVTTAYLVGTSDAAVERLVREQLAQRVRAPCRFEGASFSFLHGLEVRGLTMLDPDDPAGPPLVEADRAIVDYTLDLLDTGPHVTAIEVVEPKVRLRRDAEGSLSLVRALRLPKGGEGPHPRIVLRDGELTYSDPALLQGEPLALTAVNVLVAAARPKAFDLVGGTISLTGRSDILGPVSVAAVVVARDAAEFTADFPDVAIDPSLPARFAGPVAARVAATRPEGSASARVEGRFEEGRPLEARGVVHLRDVAASVTLPEEAGRAAPEPLAVSKLAARVVFDGNRVDVEEASFHAAGAEFRARASLADAMEPEPAFSLELGAESLPLTRELRAFLPHVARRVVEAYDLTGTIGLAVEASGTPAAPEVDARARVRDGRVRYEGYVREDGVRRGFAWTVTDVAGDVSFDGKTVRLAAGGRHGPARAHLEGTVVLNRDAPDLPDIRIRVEEAPLDEDLRTAFGDRAPKLIDPWNPSGIAQRVDVHVTRDPVVDAEHDVVEVTIHLDGRAGGRPVNQLPVPLTGIAGKIEILEPIVDGQRRGLVRLTGLSAEAEGLTVSVSGDVRRDAQDKDREDLRIALATPDASGAFRAALDSSPVVPRGVKDALRKLALAGPLRADVRVVDLGGGERADTAVATLLGVSVKGWDDVPLAARGVTGRVSYAGDTLTFEDLAGTLAMERSPRFTARGRLLDVSGEPDFDVHVESEEVPLGEPLRAALGPLAEDARAFWEEVRPVGARAAVVLDVRPRAHETPFEVTLSDIRGRLQPLGLELDNDAGTLHYDGRTLTVTGLESAIGAASLRFDTAVYEMATGRLDVRASVRGLHFPEDLEGPLDAATIASIVEEAPNRTLHALDARIAYERASRTLSIAAEVSVRPRSRRALPDPGWAPQGSLAAERLVFRLPEEGPTTFEGRAFAQEFSLRAGLAVDRLDGHLDFEGAFGDDPRFELRTQGSSFRIEEYPFEDATTRLTLTRRGARVETKAGFMGGRFEGQVGPGDDRTAYRGRLLLEGARLERFLTFRGDPQREVATGNLDVAVAFENATGAREDLRGEAAIRISDGRLLPVPVFGAIASVLDVLTLGVLGSSGDLSDAAARLELNGEWLEVRDLELRGSGGVVEGGTGTIGLDGRIDLWVYPRFEPGLPLVDWIVRLIQQPFPRAVHVTGTLRNPRTRYEPIPSALLDRRREPQPAGDVREPRRDPW